MSAHTFEPVRSDTCTPSRAARELNFLRGEFDLAVQLGHVRTVPDEGGEGADWWSTRSSTGSGRRTDSRTRSAIGCASWAPPTAPS
nr:DUF6397 family protein [Streptomyces sp. DconLS]